MNWTDEQLEAINADGCNLLVAAGAGSGKTAVLVERIIRKITDKKNHIDIDNLLVVTFTNAAAAEMRERVANRLTQKLDENPEDKSLQKQLTLLNKSRITTIHSFCLEVIKNNFHCIDLDPDFRIADGTESVLLKQESIDELFEEKYISPEFIKLVDSYGGGRDDTRLKDLVLSLYEFSISSPWPENWLKSAAEKFNLDENFSFEDSDIAHELLNSAKLELEGSIELVRRAENIVNSSCGIDNYMETLEYDMQDIEKLLKSCSLGFQDSYESFNSYAPNKLKRCGKDADKSAQKEVQDIRKKVKENIASLKDELFSQSVDEITKNIKNMYPLMKCFCDIVIEFEERYGEKKKEKGILDFNDLEHLCLEILTQNEEVTKNYRDTFDEIMVDEYQDINNVQETIINLVSKVSEDKPNVFMVGDVKQSIYRFRQADPGLFLKKYKNYSGEAPSKYRKIKLYKNFRSRVQIIDAVNFFFHNIMSRDVGEIDYNENEKLNFGADYYKDDKSMDYSVELHIMDKKDTKKDDDVPDLSEEDREYSENTEDEDLTTAQIEARMTGKIIKELIEKNKDIKFKDIVILMRAASSSAPVFLEELGKMNIPSFADTGTGYFETSEIKTMMSLLKIIDNPMQDIPLLSVMHSAMFSFSPEELIDIRLMDTEAPFYTAVKKSAEDNKKSRDFLNKLGDWRKKSLFMPIDELIWYLYSDTGYYAYVGAVVGGVQRQANLRILFERARQYESTSFKGLFNFITFINRLKKSSGDMGSAKILGENEDVVRIMSIHKSKGLQFPIVILSGTGKKFNTMDVNKPILFDKEFGLGPDYVDAVRRISYPTIYKEAVKRKIKAENLAEEMRILYVALTRAEEKLIITGTVSNIQNRALKWALGGKSISKYEIMKASGYIDWIGAALLRHEDGKVLRDISESNDVNLIEDDPSRFKIKLWKKSDVIENGTNEDEDFSSLTEKFLAEKPSKYHDEIFKKLNYEYPYKKFLALPAKVSVTELKKIANADLNNEYASNMFELELVKRPEFLETSKGFTKAKMGTVMHSVMQHIDLKGVDSIQNIKSQIEKMVYKEILTLDEARTVNAYKIYEFFKSDLGIRMLKSKDVKREMPFYMELEKSPVILQGIIDCFFEEDDGIVLIDYKTDYVSEDNMGEIKERYKVQIEYYEKALKKMTGKDVIGKYIYLFSTGQEIQYK